ncbi:AraC family transcriptional regulator [Pseudonocardia endophytica]|nr:AraC family transcriptional regulator [Pseudonocardia endophytica]
MLREHFVALDVADAHADGPFGSEVRSTLVGHLSVAEVSSAPQSCVRSGRLVREDPETYLQVGMLARGRAVVEQDGREAVLEPGRFVVYETDRPFSWHFPEPWTLLVLTWPRHLVDLDVDLSRSATARPFGDGRLGGIVARSLAESVLAPPEQADVGRRLAGELSSLVGTTFGGHPDDEPLSIPAAAGLRHRVAAYIADHIEDGDLGVEALARAHYVSVRGLHRAFAGVDMSVGSLIRTLRLAHARQRLADPRDAGLSLTEIAAACGFADLPTFSRGFKTEFQESPSTYRRRSGTRTSA